ncbi:MAG: FecR family protein [Saprospiraceae bacterium]|nr:FecR family protein [Saprospiraceae bacterium]
MKKNYHTYQVSDFIEDKDFMNWLAHPDSTSSKEFYEVISSNKDTLQKAENAKAILLSLQYKNLNKSRNKDKIWSSIQNDISTTKGKSRRLWPLIAVAAASIGFILYFTLFRPEIIIEKSQLAEHRLIRLPDDSFVTLNADSEIQYDKTSFAKKRRIQLKGEAYFQVKKGNPFSVETAQGEVKVIGTSFNIYSRNDIMNVSCMIGKVIVQFINQQNAYTLNAGMSVSNANNTITKSNFNIEEHKFWRDGYFYYNNESLVQVMEELKRQYNIKTLNYTNNLLHYKYSGFFKKDNLNEAIESVFLPLKLNATFENGILSIKE